MAVKRASKRKPGNRNPQSPTKQAVAGVSPEVLEIEVAEPHCPVVGVGASAGGLEAFSEVLHRIPEDTGLAIVFIQHLDPKHASVLSELLASATRMPVRQVTDKMRVERNHVYVIPPNTSITIRNAELLVEPRPPGPHLAIDRFFQSLAEDQGSRAIGVVLSGTATDGTMGLKSIKEAGGITFAQDPATAKYDGMPRSAIAAGYVDAMLSPGAIAAELARLCRHPYLNQPRAAEEPDDTQQDLGAIFALLRNAKDVDFAHYKPGTIRRRALRRMALHKATTPEQYVRFLREHPAEVDLLFQDILINVTAFFREGEAFEAIKSKVLPAILKKRSAEEAVRVWVPGCATGEEAYSLAICLIEQMREIAVEAPVQIFGTDLSEAALQTARSGVYSESIVAQMSAERLKRFFVRVNGTYQVARSVRDMCIFARHNVAKDPPFSRLDLITCRNLLIYLGSALQTKVIRTFHYALKPSGFLVLGASESVGAAAELFSAVDRHNKIYIRRSAPVASAGEFAVADDPETRASEKPPAAPPPDVHRRVDQIILARYSPPAVVVDKDLNVRQFRGETSPYLKHQPGVATLNLIKLSGAGLGAELQKLIRKADSKSDMVKSGPISLSLQGQVRTFAISVSRLQGTPDAQFLVVFEDFTPPPSPRRKVKLSSADGRVGELEQELATTRQYLQSVIEDQEAATEELKSAHEELQSGNEELQSTNEELLTAKEELQSANEELTTVNEEMQGRNSELQQINNDLANLLASVNIPILMLGNDLRIRRFTPGAEKILNLIPADTGRHIGDLRLKINVPDLVEMCQEVIDRLAPREREVQDAEGRTHSMWLRPYRTTDNRIGGVVLALLDITERKQSAEARYRRLFEAAKDGIVIADAATGEIVDSNPFITTAFGHQRARLIGVRFWDSEIFRGAEVDEAILNELLNQESVYRSTSLPALSGDRVPVEIVASAYTEGERKVIQFNIRDVSARKRMEDALRRNDETLKQAQKMEAVGRLAGGVAHDFNNILTAILGYTDLLASELGEGRAQHMVEQIRMAADRAATLTKQLLAFGRKQVVSPKVLDVNQVMTEMRQMASVTLHKDTELIVRLDPQAGRVRADRAQLEQVVLNLVLNARDAMPKGGTITVSTENRQVDEQFSEQHPSVPVGSYVAITVQDTGTGMDEETQAHLFEPFFTTKGSGVGLGLSTAYNIVRQNGGYIRAFSEIGVGSTFTVYLPRVEAQASDAPESAPDEGGHGTETILLVEDEHAVRALAKRFLELRGYTVLDAANGPEALRVSREYGGRIQLLLTDVVMPRMSGREVALQLASERPDMKVMYMSGHTEDAIIHHGVLEEGVAFLQKPFNQKSLVTRVRRVLDGEAEQPRPEPGAEQDGGI